MPSRICSCPASSRARLAPACALTFTATAGATAAARGPADVANALARALARHQGGAAASAPAVDRNAGPAADQFLVRRGDAARRLRERHRGLPLVRRLGPRHHDRAARARASRSGATTIAAGILRTFARFVERRHAAEPLSRRRRGPEYNTADATLWFFHALSDYSSEAATRSCMRELFPTLDRDHSNAHVRRHALRHPGRSGGWAAARRRARQCS